MSARRARRAHSPPRASEPVGRCRPSPSPDPSPSPGLAADGAPTPAAPTPAPGPAAAATATAAAAAAAETMDAGAAPRKHSRCRAAPVAAPGTRWTRGGAAALGGGPGRRGEGARAAPLVPAATAAWWAEMLLRSRPRRGGPPMLEGSGRGVGVGWAGAGEGSGLFRRPPGRAEGSGGRPLRTFLPWLRTDVSPGPLS